MKAKTLIYQTQQQETIGHVFQGGWKKKISSINKFD